VENLGTWIELSVEIDREAIDAISEILTNCGANGFEEGPPRGVAPTLIQPWETDRKAPVYPRAVVRAWFDEEGAEAATQKLTEKHPALDIQKRTVADEDWAQVWKQHHHRTHVSGEFWIAPPWEAQPGDLIIPPGNAFGTGEHPSTLECLRKIQTVAAECTHCLDVGCGSGILALAAARAGLRAEGIDIDPPSVDSAIENARLNHLEAHFSTTPIERVTGQFDLVVANLFAEVLCALRDDLIRVSSHHLILAGILNEKADTVIAALCPELTLVERIEGDAWTCLHLQRIS